MPLDERITGIEVDTQVLVLKMREQLEHEFAVARVRAVRLDANRYVIVVRPFQYLGIVADCDFKHFIARHIGGKSRINTVDLGAPSSLAYLMTCV